ncbi:ATP-binding protein, partial [Myxococcota bacterium]|nr:ATP-binding protein [Myxococcota bacterium]
MDLPPLIPRLILPRMQEALSDSPVVLLHGPRQCGKTTLTRHVGELHDYRYLSFDDDVQRRAAQFDPVGFVAELPDRVILDEIQRVPELFTSIKAAVDARRQPGRFILTGSANVLLIPRLADSLAGRMELLRLHPLAQAELAGGSTDFLTTLFQGRFRTGPAGARMGRLLAERMAAGGFPAALTRSSARRQAAWYRDYAETLVQRDIRELARISALDAIPRLLTLAAGQTARLLNVSELAGPFAVSRTTIREYVTLLSRIFLLEELPPWHSNRLSRLVKTPKLHLGDTGLACALLGVDADALWQDRSLFGQLLETFVHQELRRQASWSDTGVTFFHYRDKDQVEVDLVLEAGPRLAGVEVKAAATVTPSDFRGLRRLQEAEPGRFVGGIVLYDGAAVVPFGE